MTRLFKPLMAGSLIWLWAVWLSASLANAHLADEGVQAFLNGVLTAEHGTQSLSVTIANNSGRSITLRGIMTQDGDVVRIQRKKTVLWTEAFQPVKFLRLSPGEQAFLEPPDYLISLPGVSQNALMSGRTRLVADFGPEGQIDLMVSGPLGGVIGAPFQTTE